MLSRAATTVEGSEPASASTMLSGIGCSHGTSLASTSSSPACPPGAPRPVGSGRRCLPSRLVRQTLVAIRCSQVRTDDRPSNEW